MNRLAQIRINEQKDEQQNFAFDPQTGDTYQLNSSAVEMLKLFKKDLQDHEIIAILAKKYKMPADDIMADLMEFKLGLKIFGLYP